MDMKQLASRARDAAILLATVETARKDQALAEIARALNARTAEIVKANQADLARSEQVGLAAPLMKRLRFDAPKIADARAGIDSLMHLPDPVGITHSALELSPGLELYRVSCPIGVIGVIFESRPDALVQISSLCLKSGNAVLLKGGSEAAETNRILADLIQEATVSAGMPEGWLGLLETRAEVSEMLNRDEAIDLIIPRGSNAFVKHIMDNTRIPVLGHADGICHVYVDRAADPAMALRVVEDSKCQYVAVCNAAETLLVHHEIAGRFLPDLSATLARRNVELRGCARTRRIIDAVPATERDWQTEYLDLILSIRVVDSLDDAIGHINRYGSGHTDVIVTAERQRAMRFMDLVDSADVFHNCSSRFSDGFRFGLGAEVGISTNKIHARGPVGLEGLMIYKWRMVGDGHIVADHSGPDAKPFTHRMLEKDFNALRADD